MAFSNYKYALPLIVAISFSASLFLAPKAYALRNEGILNVTVPEGWKKQSITVKKLGNKRCQHIIEYKAASGQYSFCQPIPNFLLKPPYKVSWETTIKFKKANKRCTVSIATACSVLNRALQVGKCRGVRGGITLSKRCKRYFKYGKGIGMENHYSVTFRNK